MVKRSAGYAGRDIAQLCKEATGRMIIRANDDITSAVDNGIDAIKAYQVQVQPLNASDFAHAFQTVQPSTTATQARRYTDWSRATSN